MVALNKKTHLKVLKAEAEGIFSFNVPSSSETLIRNQIVIPKPNGISSSITSATQNWTQNGGQTKEIISDIKTENYVRNKALKSMGRKTKQNKKRSLPTTPPKQLRVLSQLTKLGDTHTHTHTHTHVDLHPTTTS